MGSTFVRYGSSGFEANDATLEVWLALMVAAIDELDRPPAWLAEVREEWHTQATAGFGFGVDPGLDDVATTKERRDVILDLSALALTRLRRYGPSIPKDELNAILQSGDGSTFTGDVPTERFETVGEYFVRLLRGELRSDETDARFPRRT